MVTAEARELIRRLRLGVFDPGEIEAIAKLPADQLLSELMHLYPIVFQERGIGRKREVGLARSRRRKLVVRKLRNSLFPLVHPQFVLSRCLFVDAYDDSLSGITVTAGIRVWPKGGSRGDVVLKIGRGYALDRTRMVGASSP